MLTYSTSGHKAENLIQLVQVDRQPDLWGKKLTKKACKTSVQTKKNLNACPTCEDDTEWWEE